MAVYIPIYIHIHVYVYIYIYIYIMSSSALKPCMHLHFTVGPGVQVDMQIRSWICTDG